MNYLEMIPFDIALVDNIPGGERVEKFNAALTAYLERNPVARNTLFRRRKSLNLIAYACGYWTVELVGPRGRRQLALFPREKLPEREQFKRFYQAMEPKLLEDL